VAEASFDPALVALAGSEKEVELTTYGRTSGKPSKKIIWISVVGSRLYIRSGMGMTRDWPKNLLARPEGILHIAGQEVPVRARHVTDPEEARSMHAPVKTKYDAARPASTGDEPLTPSEQAVFELLPAQ